MAVMDSAKRSQGSPYSSLVSWLGCHMKILFILPSLIFVLAMMIFPISYTAWLSLTAWNGSAKQDPDFLGLANYINLLTNDSRFGAAVLRTFIFSLAAVGVEILLGLGIALLLQGKFVGQNLIKTLILLPM